MRKVENITGLVCEVDWSKTISGEASLKFMSSKKATKIDEIYIINLTLCSKSQIDGKDFVNFCGLLRKHKLYHFLFVCLESKL